MKIDGKLQVVTCNSCELCYSLDMNNQAHSIQLPEKELVESLWYSDSCQSVAEVCELTGAVLVTWINVSSCGDIHENQSALVEDSSLRFSRYTYLHLTSELLVTQPRGYRCRGMSGLPQVDEVLAMLAREQVEPEAEPVADITSPSLAEPISPVVYCVMYNMYCSFYILHYQFSPSPRPCIRAQPDL